MSGDELYALFAATNLHRKPRPIVIALKRNGVYSDVIQVQQLG
jgi:hypothetical protein